MLCFHNWVCLLLWDIICVALRKLVNITREFYNLMLEFYGSIWESESLKSSFTWNEGLSVLTWSYDSPWKNQGSLRITLSQTPKLPEISDPQRDLCPLGWSTLHRWWLDDQVKVKGLKTQNHKWKYSPWVHTCLVGWGHG